MLDVWAAHLSQPICPISTHQKTLFTQVNLSLMYFTHNIHVEGKLFPNSFSKWSHTAKSPAVKRLTL
jgi:hypothetical protein